MHAAEQIAGIIENKFSFQGSMTMQVNGVFQEVPHFHMHVFGRNRDNDIAIHYPPKTNKDPIAFPAMPNGSGRRQKNADNPEQVKKEKPDHLGSGFY